MSFGSQRAVVVCAGASFNGSVRKCGGVGCEARALSCEACACAAGLVRDEQSRFSRRWQTHGRECHSIHRVQFSKGST